MPLSGKGRPVSVITSVMTEESLYDEPDFGLRKKASRHLACSSLRNEPFPLCSQAPPQPEEEEILREGYLQKAGRIFKVSRQPYRRSATPHRVSLRRAGNDAGSFSRTTSFSTIKTKA